MTNEQLIGFVTALAPDQKPGVSKQYPECIITADQLKSVCTALKSDPETKMDYLMCETATDRKDGLNVVYHLTSSVHQHILVLKVILTDKVNPVIPTVSDIWMAAEFFEREIFDLFGIRFEGHPDMRRLFLEDDWVGFPLRKDYKDTFTIER